MRIFDEPDTWGGKVNFVDENNVFVGYDMGQCCCENADWFIADEVAEYKWDAEHSKELADQESYRFDPDFFERGGASDLEEGEMIVFRLVGPAVKYLHIFNAHNGYYGHGFTTENFNSPIPVEGCL